jgi:hypothetical protein
MDIRHKTHGLADIGHGSNYHPPRMLKEWTKWAGLHGMSISALFVAALTWHL